MKKISRAHGDGMLSPLAPLDVRFAFQDVRDGFLQAVMMDSRLRSGLDKKRSGPERRVDAQVSRHCREPQRTRRLRGTPTELMRTNDADGVRLAFVHALFDVPTSGRLRVEILHGPLLLAGAQSLPMLITQSASMCAGRTEERTKSVGCLDSALVINSKMMDSMACVWLIWLNVK
jgi:hypothetical protein